jgi:hypothetical protein
VVERVRAGGKEVVRGAEGVGSEMVEKEEAMAGEEGAVVAAAPQSTAAFPNLRPSLPLPLLPHFLPLLPFFRSRRQRQHQICVYNYVDADVDSMNVYIYI